MANHSTGRFLLSYPKTTTNLKNSDIVKAYNISTSAAWSVCGYTGHYKRWKSFLQEELVHLCTDLNTMEVAGIINNNHKYNISLYNRGISALQLKFPDLQKGF